MGNLLVCARGKVNVNIYSIRIRPIHKNVHRRKKTSIKQAEILLVNDKKKTREVGSACGLCNAWKYPVYFGC